MFKETPEGQTNFCQACEAQARATPEALELIKDMKHTCGKDKKVETNPWGFFWGF